MEKTHGKQYLCRAFFFERTAKSLFVVRFFFAVRSIKNARQISSLLCARKKRTAKILAHGKHGFSGSVGKSECGIYYISLFWHQLRVWVLHEASEYFRVQRQSGS
jgi:hypothetical protein